MYIVHIIECQPRYNLNLKCLRSGREMLQTHFRFRWWHVLYSAVNVKVFFTDLPCMVQPWETPKKYPYIVVRVHKIFTSTSCHSYRFGNSLIEFRSELLVFAKQVSKWAICSKSERFAHSLIFGERPEWFAHDRFPT